MSLAQKYKECQTEIYNDLLREGTEAFLAKQISEARVANAIDVIEDVFTRLDSNELHIKLRKTFSLDQIRSSVSDWDDMERNEQSELLEKIGFDTMRCHWIEAIGEYIGSDGRRTTGGYILGSERTDLKWINTRLPNGERCASDAAVDVYRERIGLGG